MAITLNDLVKCGQGDIIVSMLIDAKAFFDYDQRENGQTLEGFDDFWFGKGKENSNKEGMIFCLDEAFIFINCYFL